MTITDTAPTTTVPQFATALIAVGAFLAAHPDLPALIRVAIGSDPGGFLVYVSHTQDEETPEQAEDYAARWAAALGTTPTTHSRTLGVQAPYISHSAEAQIAPGVSVLAYFQAALAPVEPVLAG
ncbi:MAG TPA: hypothetical protein VGX23_14245 [Actinocrinis sp.]|nr:hypothetical protein [Actinocrinis sp.]